jgi:putative transposase
MLRIKAAFEIEQGIIVNRKLVHRIMRELGIQGLPGPKKGHRDLVNVATQEDLVQRVFTAQRVNALWLSDITEHATAKARSTAARCWISSLARSLAGLSIDAARTTSSTTRSPWLAKLERPHARR